jgi:hypothetical protein
VLRQRSDVEAMPCPYSPRDNRPRVHIDRWGG